MFNYLIYYEKLQYVDNLIPKELYMLAFLSFFNSNHLEKNLESSFNNIQMNTYSDMLKEDENKGKLGLLFKYILDKIY